MPIVSSPPLPVSEPRSVANIYHLLGQGVVQLPGDEPLFNDWLTTFGDFPAQTFPSAADKTNWPTDIIDQAWEADVLHLTCHGTVAEDVEADAGRTEPPAQGWTLDLH